MALSSFIKFCGLILLGIILQSYNISALQCYDCMVTPTMSPEEYPAEQDCLKDIPPDEFLVNETSLISLVQESAGTLRQEVITAEFQMIQGPFCLKISPTDINAQASFIVRRMVAEGPEARDLDDYGCIADKIFRMCFCNEDKCNGDDWRPRSNSGFSSTSQTCFFWIVSFTMLARKSL